jgi:hypothetical protein
MTDYTQLDGPARLEELARLAQLVYGKRWKGLFAADFGLRAATVSSWGTRNTAPEWALRAMFYAEKAKRLDDLRAALAGCDVQT